MGTAVPVQKLSCRRRHNDLRTRASYTQKKKSQVQQLGTIHSCSVEDLQYIANTTRKRRECTVMYRKKLDHLHRLQCEQSS